MEVILLNQNFCSKKESSEAKYLSDLESFLISAFAEKYDNTLFRWSEKFQLMTIDGDVINRVFYFDAVKRITYILETEKEKEFITTHSEFIIVERRPDFYSFNLPCLIENFSIGSENGMKFHLIDETRYSKNSEMFFLKEPQKIFFIDGSFIFSKLEPFVLHFNLNVEDFINPVFSITENEFKYVYEYANRACDQIEKDFENGQQLKHEQYYDNLNEEFREESYRETFNNDPSNEWNID